MLIRESLEERERANLSPHAALSAESAGRDAPETPDSVRTCYQRDRDRIIHLCRAFRRLANKTQVFISPREDHLRTRLSHTLEVAQIARTICRALRLNEDLAEAISLAHDVGHTPFGHSGESALDEAYRAWDPEGSFAHHLHSLRVVEELERDGAGLNLTVETREGIVLHSKGMADLSESMGVEPQGTLEADVVRVSDRFAYLNHDLDDCLRAGVLRQDDLPEDLMETLGHTHSTRVGRMVEDLISNSLDSPALSMSEPMLRATDGLKRFLWESVYTRPELLEDRKKVEGIISGLFEVYMTGDAALHEMVGYVPDGSKRRARLSCDYIAGMTDRFATEQYIKHFLPSSYPY
ncbi:MAG: deoxyguanosinetriphosphate triphosphohydrolase [Armatimonadota bacterium]